MQKSLKSILTIIVDTTTWVWFNTKKAIWLLLKTTLQKLPALLPILPKLL